MQSPRIVSLARNVGVCEAGSQASLYYRKCGTNLESTESATCARTQQCGSPQVHESEAWCSAHPPQSSISSAHPPMNVEHTRRARQTCPRNTHNPLRLARLCHRLPYRSFALLATDCVDVISRRYQPAYVARRQPSVLIPRSHVDTQPLLGVHFAKHRFAVVCPTRKW